MVDEYDFHEGVSSSVQSIFEEVEYDDLGPEDFEDPHYLSDTGLYKENPIPTEAHPFIFICA